MQDGGKLSKYYADDTMLTAGSKDDLQHTVNEFERACKKMGLNTNADSGKVQVVTKGQSANTEKAKVNGTKISRSEDERRWGNGGRND